MSMFQLPYSVFCYRNVFEVIFVFLIAFPYISIGIVFATKVGSKCTNQIAVSVTNQKWSFVNYSRFSIFPAMHVIG